MLADLSEFFVGNISPACPQGTGARTVSQGNKGEKEDNIFHSLWKTLSKGKREWDGAELKEKREKRKEKSEE